MTAVSDSYTSSPIPCKSKPKIVRLATFSLLLALLLLSGGCAVKFVYNQLDWAIPWYLDDYMSLNNEQEDDFNIRLERYLGWHRKTQLPLYAEFLNRVASDLERGINEASIAYIRKETETLGTNLVQRLLPDVLPLFAGVSDKQISQLFEKFAEDNNEYREDYIDLSEKEQRKKRAKLIEDYVERWTGRLNSEQRDLIREGTQQYLLMCEDLLQAKLAWQDEFARILSLREQPEKYEPAMKALLTSQGYGQSAEFERKFTENEKILTRLYLKLDQSLTEKQRTRAVKKLRAYAEDFFELSQP